MIKYHLNIVNILLNVVQLTQVSDRVPLINNPYSYSYIR